MHGMADPNDVSGTKMARSLFGRRGIDVSRADLRVMHGVCYLRGTISAIRGFGVEDLKGETANVARLLRQKPEIRDVVIDVTYRQ